MGTDTVDELVGVRQQRRECDTVSVHAGKSRECLGRVFASDLPQKEHSPDPGVGIGLEVRRNNDWTVVSQILVDRVGILCTHDEIDRRGGIEDDQKPGP